MLNQKGFIAILFFLGILVLSAGIIGGTYYLKTLTTAKSQILNPVITSNSSPSPTPNIIPSSSPDTTSNWKTYTNVNYKFTFKYPQTFYEKAINQTNTYYPTTPITWLLLLADSQKPVDQAHNPEIDIGFFPKQTTLNFDDWLKTRTTINDDSNNPTPEDKDKIYFGVKNITKLTVNNLPAISFSSSNGASTNQDNILIDHGDQAFIIQSVTTPLGKIDDSIFNQILSTFQFTDQNTNTTCQTDQDCQNGSSCRSVGPIIKNAPITKECVTPGTAVPL